VSAVPVYSEADVRAALTIHAVIDAVSDAIAREVLTGPGIGLANLAAALLRVMQLERFPG
jgi:hypothetical protein